MTIDSDFKLDDLTLIKHLKSIDSTFLPKIQETYDMAKDILNSRVIALICLMENVPFANCSKAHLIKSASGNFGSIIFLPSCVDWLLYPIGAFWSTFPFFGISHAIRSIPAPPAVLCFWY